MSGTKSFLMRLTDPEYKRAFFSDEVKYGPLAECPDCGETWQYMGTVENGSGYVHEFRHRHHPDTGGRLSARVPADPSWKPEEKAIPDPVMKMVEDYLGIGNASALAARDGPCDLCGHVGQRLSVTDAGDGGVLLLCETCFETGLK